MTGRHLSESECQDYRRGSMGPADLLAASDHIATCDECYDLLGSEAELPALYAFERSNLQLESAPECEHISYEQVAAYVDGEIAAADRPPFERHLDSCADCKRSVQELNAIRAACHFSVEIAPGPSPPGASLAISKRWLFGTRANLWAVGLASIALLVVVALSLYTLLMLRSARTENALTQDMLRQRDSVISDLQTRLSQLQDSNRAVERDINDLRQDLSAATGLVIHHSGGLGSGGNRIAVSLKDGGRIISLDQNGSLTGVDGLSSQDRRLVAAVLASRRVQVPRGLQRLAGRPLTLMGSSSTYSFADASPIGTNVLTDRPSFKWPGLPGAASYVVSIYDTHMNEVASSPVLPATGWTVALPLQRGSVYTWLVRATKDGREIRLPSPDEGQARFRILSLAESDAVIRDQNLYANLHLVLGSIYASFGLLDDAKRELQMLAAANPDSSDARQLLDSITKIRSNRN